MQPPQPFMNAPNQLYMSQMGDLGPQNNANYNNHPMFPMHNAAPQMNLSQIQGQILAQNLLNLLQQPNMNMNMNMNVPNAQFCPPVSYPMQNMNQQLPMQMQRQNLSQGVPYSINNGPNPNPMFRFPNQVNHAMVPQNPMFSGNPQFGVVPGNQVRPQIDPNEKHRVPANGNTTGFVSGGPFPPQQLQGNSSVPQNSNNAQSSAFRNSHSQENPNSNFANSNWKGSPNKNFKNKQNRGGSQGGFQKSKFRDNNKGTFGLNSEELQQEPKK
ncbi:hypothetical protein TSUD_178950 [Trifolium subterraneum]|uniref:Uncharacterized protein n=1 Tax=Trifolium subterraneum TaxID=3900 RepID=A0A2Z6M9L3_TRISU|nr:hypothetical protein TSUD_178950 [Trifolium subterraneum]